MHYDLLSVIYKSHLDNDYSYLNKWIKNYNSCNVDGLIANLYFLDEDSMNKELGNKCRNINVLEMFKISTDILKKLLPNTKVIFSIEGCDYIQDEKELEELYKLGLRNILLVWNNTNKYGSGNESDSGLTDKGRKFLSKAIDLGICIDLSHMNYKTFYDTIDLLREKKNLGKDVKVIVSHSNCYELCNDNRNLTKKQILDLKEFDPIIGVVSYAPFVCGENIDIDEIKDKYLEHIEYVVSLLGIDNVGVSTDNMNFPSTVFKSSIEDGIFEYSNIKNELIDLLGKRFNKEEMEKILYKNIERKLF